MNDSLSKVDNTFFRFFMGYCLSFLSFFLSFCSFLCVSRPMIVNPKRFFWEIDIDISKYSDFESRRFQSISAKFSDRGSLCWPQSEASDYLFALNQRNFAK